MRPVLYSEIAKERCNAKAFGAFNSAVNQSAQYNAKLATEGIRSYLDSEKTNDTRNMDLSVRQIAKAVGSSEYDAIGLINVFGDKSTRKQANDFINRDTRAKAIKEAKENGFVTKGINRIYTRKSKNK